VRGRPPEPDATDPSPLAHHHSEADRPFGRIGAPLTPWGHRPSHGETLQKPDPRSLLRETVITDDGAVLTVRPDNDLVSHDAATIGAMYAPARAASVLVYQSTLRSSRSPRTLMARTSRTKSRFSAEE
jgi:hypothetical protein